MPCHSEIYNQNVFRQLLLFIKDLTAPIFINNRIVTHELYSSLTARYLCVSQYGEALENFSMV